LGVSVALFLAIAAIHLAIGILAPILSGRMTPAFVLTGTRADEALFGRPAADVLADPAIAIEHGVMVRWVAALLLALGTLEAAVAWFGLREGAMWALIVLLIATAAMGAVDWLSFAPYRSAGVTIGLSEYPPYQWLPVALFIPAAIAGWVGVTKVTALPALLP
jgi:hypothetical protein